MLVVAAALFGGSVILTAISPTIILAMCSLVIVGFFSISFTSLANATLQLESAPEMQGRVMSLWTVAFLGTTPIGGPLMGAVGEHVGARWALAAGGVAALIAAGLSVMSVRQGRKTPALPDQIGNP